MNGDHDLAVYQCELAERALTQVALDAAIGAAMHAKDLVGALTDSVSAAIYTRAAIAEVDGLALRDELRLAETTATAAVIWSEYWGAGNRWEADAYLKLFEVHEMQLRYREAASGFESLHRALPDEPWAARIKLSCANHLISIGVHNADPFLAARGIALGDRVRARVTQADEVAAWLQWRGLHESRRAQFENAASTFEESFTLRARNRRRDLTRQFLEAEMAFAVNEDAGVAALVRALADARAAGLTRHVRAAARHMSRLVA
jgi:hypothetical protein